MGQIADKWGAALNSLKDAYRLPPLEAFSLALQVETVALLEGLREDMTRLFPPPKTMIKPKATSKAGAKRGRPSKAAASDAR